MALITVSVVSHGQGHLVCDLLRDLSRQTIADELDVVLTLNVPEPELGLAASRFGLRVKTIHNLAPKGFGANHNAALHAASTPWVMVINPDIRLSDRAMMEKLVGRHAHDRSGLVAPLIQNSRGEREDSIRTNLDPFSLLGRAVLRRKAIIDPAVRDRRFRWVAGMFMALPLAVWQTAGGFNERFFLYCEDYDLCARLTLQGYPVKVDETLVAVHDAQRSSRKSLRYLKWHIGSLIKVWGSVGFWRIWFLDVRATFGK